MSRELQELDAMTLKSLLNTLIRKGASDEIEKSFDVVLPTHFTLIYKCSMCGQTTRNKLIKADIRGTNQYIRCPFCKKNSYAQTLHVERKMDRRDFDSWFDV